MTQWLVFGLSATLASMGDLAGHERRGSLMWPGRSAVIGLMGAALGLRRTDDFTRLDALGVAVAVFDTGTPLRDFHTVQSVPSAVAKRPQSRPDAIAQAGQRLNTTLTLRDYRAGVLYGVAVSGAEETLEDVAKALMSPVFHLYLGRKACPLSAPPTPVRVAAPNVETALSHLRLPPWRANAVATTMICDAEPDDTYRDTRHDTPVSRQKWHFAARDLAIRTVHIQPGTRLS
ncbi:MAG: type I-E CRISPR-associated protein Cas5/CasD [Paracoccaceae bacterium]